MSGLLRTTVYLDAEIHRALKMKAAETSSTISELVGRAVRTVLLEDLEDLQAIREREQEPARPLEDFLAELARDGHL